MKRTVKFAALSLVAVLALTSCKSCNSEKTSDAQDTVTAATAARTSAIKINVYGVGKLMTDGPVNVEEFKTEGYSVSTNDEGALEIKTADGEVVVSKLWETITVTGYEFETEKGIHVGMPIVEAVPLFLDGETLVIYGVDDEQVLVCRRFTSGSFEEDDSIAFILPKSAVREESRDKLRNNPKMAEIGDFDPGAKITAITITQLI